MFNNIPKEAYYIIWGLIILYFVMSMWGSNKMWDINGNSGEIDFSKQSNLEFNVTQENKND